MKTNWRGINLHKSTPRAPALFSQKVSEYKCEDIKKKGMKHKYTIAAARKKRVSFCHTFILKHKHLRFIPNWCSDMPFSRFASYYKFSAQEKVFLELTSYKPFIWTQHKVLNQTVLKMQNINVICGKDSWITFNKVVYACGHTPSCFGVLIKVKRILSIQCRCQQSAWRRNSNSGKRETQ